MPKTLLLADDSVTIQKVVGIVFAGEDYRVTAVGNGEDALRKAREARPDVVLADAAMPRMNGYELCQALKSDPQFADVPVLLLTGTFEPFDEVRARAARADGHVAKPFDSQSLLTRVRELVEGVTADPLPLPYPRLTPVPAPSPALRPAPAAAPPRRTVPPPFPPPGHPLRAGVARPGALPPTSVKAAGVRPPPAPAPRPAASAPPPPPPPPPLRSFAPAPARSPARPPPPPEPFGMAGPATAEDDWSDVSAGSPFDRPPMPHVAPPAPPPAPAPAAPPEAVAPPDGGEAALRLALSQASREVVEKIAWEVVPQLAEVIIREHVERLVNERQKR
jgi:CheY-like chemotaxis protein